MWVFCGDLADWSKTSVPDLHPVIPERSFEFKQQEICVINMIQMIWLEPEAMTFPVTVLLLHLPNPLCTKLVLYMAF